jgi:hypothetical protein
MENVAVVEAARMLLVGREKTKDQAVYIATQSNGELRRCQAQN